jgi:hypothetical protein
MPSTEEVNDAVSVMDAVMRWLYWAGSDTFVEVFSPGDDGTFSLGLHLYRQWSSVYTRNNALHYWNYLSLGNRRKVVRAALVLRARELEQTERVQNA